MSTETIAILRAICDQIDDCIVQSKKTIAPKVISQEEVGDWRGDRYPDRRVYESPVDFDDKRKVHKYWPELVPLAGLLKRVQQYMIDVKGEQPR